MQNLTAPPRDALTDGQVLALLQTADLTVSAGCDLLAPDLTLVTDISDDLVSGTVSRNLGANVHGVCSLTLFRELVWGVALVRPHMTLQGAGVTARFNLGVYALTTPLSEIGEDPAAYAVQGFDRLYLLNREVGTEYTVTAGTTYRAALLATFAAAGLTGVLIEGAAADDVLPTTRVWSLVGLSTDPDQTSTPATWLRVINDLLRAINFRGVWADEEGRYRCEAYRDPAARASEFTFTADDPQLTILGEKRTIARDVYRTPNRWVFRQTNRPAGSPTASEGDGLYTVVNQSDGPTSIDVRGLTWNAVVDYEAATQAKLVELGDRRVASDRRLTTTFTVSTGPFPPAGHADVFTYVDTAAGGSRKVQALEWSLPLDGSEMTWSWEAVA